MYNHYIMSSNQTNEGQPQIYSTVHPSAPPAIVEQNNIQSTVNSNYPVYQNKGYNPAAQTRVITYADYEQAPHQHRQHGPRRQRVIMVDEIDYQRSRERRQREKTGFWKGIAAAFCCLFCCCPIGPGC